jgi:pantoate--beta-alanine ligase
LKIFTSKSDLSKSLSLYRQQKQSVGFVPTMGALHQGHLSLIERARKSADVVVCSIFVNPTQFNNALDLEKYPRPIEQDIKLLRETNCDVLFLPNVEEMYSQNEQWNFDLGYLEQILEGKFRSGHYQGVTQIVKKLIDAVKPDFMFLGQKDYQQIMVIRRLVDSLNLPVELIMCPIIREPDGLALSSRNIHLSGTDRKNALSLSKSLFEAKENFNRLSIEQLKANAWNLLESTPNTQPEYFEICDAATLLPVNPEKSKSIIALVAAKVGTTRLIDNIILK